MGADEAPLLRVEETTSTNERLSALAAAGAHDGTALAAERQTAGRGRRGRSWTTIDGQQILVSVLHHSGLPVARLTGLALDVGSAVAALLARRGIACELKWPNDVLIGDKKVGGILCEAIDLPEHSAAIVGLGLNVTGTPPPELPEATTLALALASSMKEAALDRDALLVEVVAAIRAACRAYELRGAPDVTAWMQRASGIGRRVRDVASGREGVMQGLAADGALLVRWDGEAAAARFIAGDLAFVREGASP